MAPLPAGSTARDADAPEAPGPRSVLGRYLRYEAAEALFFSVLFGATPLLLALEGWRVPETFAWLTVLFIVAAGFGGIFLILAPRPGASGAAP